MNAHADIRDDLATEQDRLHTVNKARLIAKSLWSNPAGATSDKTLGGLIDYHADGWRCQLHRREPVMAVFDGWCAGGTDQDWSAITMAAAREVLTPLIRQLACDEAAIRARIATIKGKAA